MPGLETEQAPLIQLDAADVEPSTDAFGGKKVDLFADEDSSNASGAADDKTVDDKATPPAKAADKADEVEQTAEEKKTAEEEATKAAEDAARLAAETPEETEAREAQEAADAEAEATATAEADKAPKGAEARKADLSREIRDLVATKNQLEQEVASKNAEVYAAQTAEELVEAGVDPGEARIQAMEQREQLRDFNQHVADVNANLNIEAVQVMMDYPIFDPNSTEFNADLSKRAKAVYESVAKMEIDPKTKLTINVAALPYNIYKAFAETYASGTSGGKVDGQRSAEKMLANAEPTGSAKPAEKTAKVDPFLQGLTKGLKISTK